MATEGNFSTETTIYVSTSSRLNAEQTQSITQELLQIMGCTNGCPGCKFRFINEGELVEAHAYVDNKLKVSVMN